MKLRSLLLILLLGSRLAAQTLPLDHTITDSAGRSMESTIISATETSIKVRRKSDGKEFDIPVARLSADDRKFVSSLYAPKAVVPDTHRKVLFHLQTDRLQPVTVADYEIVQEFIRQGYEVTLTSVQIPPEGWPVWARRSSLTTEEYKLDLPQRNFFPTGKTLTGTSLPYKNVKITDYGILFCGGQGLVGVSGLQGPLLGWAQEIDRNGGLIFFPATAAPGTKEDFLKGEPYREKGLRYTLMRQSYVDVKDNIIRFDARYEIGKRPKDADANAGNYDPEITRKLFEAIKKYKSRK